jgi:hypothetical protein
MRAMSGRHSLRNGVSSRFASGTGALGIAALLVLGCNGRLAVLDPPLGAGGNLGQGELVNNNNTGGSGVSEPSVPVADAGPVTQTADAQPEPSPCACASSEALMPLGCGTFTYGAPKLSDDGDTLAFTLCDAESVCTPYVWRRGLNVREVPRKWGFYVVDLTPDGDTALAAPIDPEAVPGGGSPAIVRYDVSSGNLTALLQSYFSKLSLMGDGSVFGFYSPPDTDWQLTRWSNGGLDYLGIVPSGLETALVAARDAQVVVGGDLIGGNLFRWTAAGGLDLVPADLPRVAAGSPLVLSRDGSAFAAYVPGEGAAVKIVHVRGGTVTELGTSERSSMAPLFLSADGTVLAGSHHPGSPNCGQNPLSCEQSYTGFRWSAVAEAPFVGSIGYPGLISALSRDGSRLVGKGPGSELRLHTWTKDRGPRDLLGDLEAAGVDLTGWELDAPTAMSADGSVVTGYARCGTGTTVYRLVLPD